MAGHADNVTELPTQNPFVEIGVSGSASVASHIYEDFLPQLRGRQALATYREMGDNDATIGSILFALEMLVRGVAWTAKPASEDVVDVAAADFLTANMAGLNHPFRDTIAQMLSAAQYGFSFHETVYDRNERGEIVWRKFGFRPQDSLSRWVLDEFNDALAFVQLRDRDSVPIPIVKGLYYRIDTSQVSGKSLIRRAYRSWFFKKRNEEKLQIGIDRNLNGIPIAYIPSEVLSAGEGDERFDMVKKIVTRTKRDEQAGIMFPSDRTSVGTRIYEFALLAPSGSPNFSEVVAVIRMYAADIAGVILAQFINLGRDAVGSRALAEPQQDLFQAALEAILDGMQDTLNRQAVKPLFELNPSLVPDGRTLPKLVHGTVRDVDLKGTGEFMRAAAQSGYEWPVGDEAYNRQVLEMAGFEASDDMTNVTQRGNSGA